MTSKELITKVEDRIDTMKKKDVNINVKCSQFDALAVVIGAAAVATAVHCIVSACTKAKIKKKIEKAYAKKYLELEESLKAEYEAKLAAATEVVAADEDEVTED